MCVCVGGASRVFPPLSCLAESSVELFMVSWFNQVLNVAPFLSLLHIRLVFFAGLSPLLFGPCFLGQAFVFPT